jgi:hypothetical protein
MNFKDFDGIVRGNSRHRPSIFLEGKRKFVKKIPKYIRNSKGGIYVDPSRAHNSGYGEWHPRGTRATQCLGV